MQDVNADLDRPALVHTDRAEWLASPSPGVWRKPLDRRGGESGRATSIVRYEPGSRFPAHEHPAGEEIFVLDGVFSDEHGDYPAGTYLLNPPASRHAPFTEPGCTLFVKLRQYQGSGRQTVRRQTAEMAWQPTEASGIRVKPLYEQSGFPERVALVTWAPGAAVSRHAHPGGIEILVLRGEVVDGTSRYRAGTWLRLPDGAEHALASPDGAEALVRAGGLGGEGTKKPDGTAAALCHAAAPAASEDQETTTRRQG